MSRRAVASARLLRAVNPEHTRPLPVCLGEPVQDQYRPPCSRIFSVRDKKAVVRLLGDSACIAAPGPAMQVRVRPGAILQGPEKGVVFAVGTRN